MKHHRFIDVPALLLPILWLAVLGTGCQSPPDESPPPSSGAAPAASKAAERSGSGEPGSAEMSAEDAVSYEPAYPADVSTEALDADDVAQQQTHSHGGAEHSHDEEHGGEQHGDGDHSQADHSHGTGHEQ